MAPNKTPAKKKPAPAAKGLKGVLSNLKKKVSGAAPAKKAAPAAPAKAEKAQKVLPTKAMPVAAPAKKGAKGAEAPAKAAKAVKAPPVVQTAEEKKLAKSAAAAVRAAARAAAYDETVCREIACENLLTTGGYCRMHYIKNWKKIKRKELILKEKKLNQYIEELVAKYPDKYIEAIREDLSSERDFAKVITDLDLDESADDFEGDGENADSFVDSIRRDFDDGDEGAF